ncbi:MAG: hypothetical protein IV100_16310 [Myxococcales bacterium]|nr:hypothetical protein [Myxococcales bacterium]
MTDSVLQEIRFIRDEISKACGYDPRRLGEKLAELDKQRHLRESLTPVSLDLSGEQPPQNGAPGRHDE